MSVVRLINNTKDAETMIAYVARVSNPQNQDNENIERLLQYCFNNKHWSVFETCYMTLEINTNITIANQLLRHRSFTFQQFSQRYANINELGQLHIPELRKQDLKNRQNSTDDLNDSLKEELQEKIKTHYKNSIDLYNELINNDVAKECARFVLPCNVSTRMYMTGNIRSWIHYLQIRCDVSTQKEHRDIANEIKDLFKTLYPIIGKLI